MTALCDMLYDIARVFRFGLIAYAVLLLAARLVKYIHSTLREKQGNGNN